MTHAHRTLPDPPAPSAAYWAGAEAAGTAVRRGGHRLVAGASTDPLTGVRGVLVEYADPGAFTDGTLEAVLVDLDAPVGATTPRPASLASVSSASSAISAASTARVQVRTPADTVLPPPWRRSVTYVSRTGPLPGRAGPAGLRIVPAEGALWPPVRDWMARAVRRGAAEQGLPAPEEAVAAAVDEVLGEPGLAVLVALLDDRPVGHAVLLTGARDTVTDRAFAELWDVLVEPEAPGAADCRDALVAASADRAAGLRLPLLGHVVHRAEEAASRALTSLLARGWHTDHTYWTATATAPGPAPAPAAAPATTPVPGPVPPTTTALHPTPISNGTPR
ncbi:hypothetical protein [Streptomyces sp. NPDC093225]|uniref:hypothetical protein n=1 Tax=Streptomyces sp. NPDC093225 TaxID=3366034 RepID=UPI00382DABAE